MEPLAALTQSLDTPAQPLFTPMKPFDTPAEPLVTPVKLLDTPVEPLFTPNKPLDTPKKSFVSRGNKRDSNHLRRKIFIWSKNANFISNDPQAQRLVKRCGFPVFWLKHHKLWWRMAYME